jgi:PAS domain S-box-containing protein
MRRVWRDAGAVLALALLTGALLASALWYLRSAAVRSGEQLTASLARVISEQSARTLQSADQALQLTIVRLQALRDTGRLDEETGRAALAEELRELPFLRAIWVVDADGRIALNSNQGGVGVPVQDRSYFDVYRKAPATGFFIGPMLRSRVSGAWMVAVSRPIRDADGSVREVVVAGLEPTYFEQLWRDIDVGTDGSVVLYRRNGQLLMRSPGDHALIGEDFSRFPVFTDYLHQAPQGTFIRKSGIDGVVRLFAYRQLAAYPELVVAVGSGYGAMLASWRRFALLTGTVWAAAVLVALGLTLQLRRHARSREQTEQRFEQLAQAMPQIVFSADGLGNVQFINQRWVELTGLPAEDALGKGWQDLIHPDDVQPTLEAIVEGLRTRQELTQEYRVRYSDGGYRWQLLRAVPVPSRSGGMLWLGAMTDIDALRRAQDQLREQAEQLHVASRLTRLGHWRIDLPARCVKLSDEAAAIMDLPPGSTPSLEEIFATIAPESVALVAEAVNGCIERGEPFDLETQLVTATGRQIWLRSVGEPVRDASGRMVALQGAQQDITLRVLMMQEIRRLNASLEERIAERTAQLARQEALFRTLAEQAPLPFWTVDLRGRITFLSRAWYELAGGAPPKWHGLEWRELVHPDDLASVEENWQRSARSGEPYAGTRRIRARDGSYHTTSYRALPVRGEAGEILFWVGVDSDITDLMDNQEALRLANEQLESFSYSVSHDLQSPLQRVGSYAKLLQQELAPLPPGRAHHYLARIQANAQDMVQLIEGLLALARVSEVEIICSVVNLSDIATEILQRRQSDEPQRQVAWRVEPGLAALGDSRLVRSVLENLLGNAWKFSSRQPRAEIVVGAVDEGRTYFVRDNGCGFDMAYADRLFGTFQRLHGADEFPGTGIGLATVARAVSRQGGRVWAQSAPGEGATFFFTLPPAEGAAG